MNVRELIPKNINDIEAAKKLNQFTYQEIKPIIPDLLEFIQDGHWDIAEPVRNYLSSISEYITDDIIRILQSNDEEWKYQCLRIVPPIIKSISLRQELERIAYRPTEQELEAGLQEFALEVLENEPE